MNDAEEQPATEAIPLSLTVHELKQRLDQGEQLLLLDCRRPEEFALCRLDDAVLLPMQELPQRVSEIQAWSDRPVVVVCHHGIRSMRVAMWLRSAGFAQAQTLTGGMDAWSCQIDPRMPRY